MNCEDLSPLMEAYLDSELDARTTLDVQHHLAGCAVCAAAFARAEEFERRLGAALQRGAASPELWAAIERRLVPRDAPQRVPVTAGDRFDRFEARTTEPWWRFWLWPSPRAYAVLAAVWVGLLGLSLGGRETGRAPDSSAARAPRPGAPSAEMKVVLAQQYRLRAELLELPAPRKATDGAIPPHSRTRSGVRSTDA